MKIGFVAAALVLANLTAGCASFSNEALLSELVNDHQPGSLQAPPAAELAAKSKGLPAGAACHFGSDCASSACEQGRCEDIGGDAERAPAAQVMVASHF